MSVKEIHVQLFKDALDALEKLALGNGDIIFRGHSNWTVPSFSS